MSRIGKAPIEIPAGVTVTVNGDLVTVKGPKGELSQKVNSDLTVKVEDGHVVVTRPSDDREHRAQHGLYRALIHNMVVGVSQGYRKEMELVGVGYRATSEGHKAYERLETEIKYAGYIARQDRMIRDVARHEKTLIPEGFAYEALTGLTLEAREKLARIRPKNLGQAGRIPGVSPSDVAQLSIALAAGPRKD